MAGDRIRAAASLMEAFAGRTGLDPPSPSPRRYLWTDAFAVCTCLGLARATGRDHWATLALRLVAQVHETLGRHREDDVRAGWISGLSEAEGARHPTFGGLRIGKPSPEREAHEPYDPKREWDRDGQYYHYLTRWMHALDRTWRATGDVTCLSWAVELAEGAHRAFLTSDRHGRRLLWKVSIDGTRAVVPSSGHHDPLDGLLTVATLADGAPTSDTETRARLDRLLGELAPMCRGRGWATDDPLGAGGLMIDAYRALALRRPPEAVSTLLHRVLADAGASLEQVARRHDWAGPARHRLGFREVGFSLGIRALARLEPASIAGLGTALTRHHALADRIERFWLEPSNRVSPTWRDHEDISDVMLATSLAPEGLLGT